MGHGHGEGGGHAPSPALSKGVRRWLSDRGLGRAARVRCPALVVCVVGLATTIAVAAFVVVRLAERAHVAAELRWKGHAHVHGHGAALLRGGQGGVDEIAGRFALGGRSFGVAANGARLGARDFRGEGTSEGLALDEEQGQGIGKEREQGLGLGLGLGLGQEQERTGWLKNTLRVGHKGWGEGRGSLDEAPRWGDDGSPDLRAWGPGQTRGAALPAWALGPFERDEDANPVLERNEDSWFSCPVRRQRVAWEAKDVFNPTAAVQDGRVVMLYRAEDYEGHFGGTSRIGRATSRDGLTFERASPSVPVLYPDTDAFHGVEWEGGCEDPRVVEAEDGTYVMTYTAYDGEIARMQIATSKDLVQWTKHGTAFPGTGFEGVWSKSGAIVSRLTVDGRVVAARTGPDNQYYMYFGEASIFCASSDDLIAWRPLPVPDTTPEEERYYLGQPELEKVYGIATPMVMRPRPGYFDSVLVEPGPPPLLTPDGILLIYNGKNAGAEKGDPFQAVGAYSTGQALFDAKNPSRILARLDEPFLRPELPFEITGQVNHVVFVEALAFFKNKFFLYYGTADSRIAAAVADGARQRDALLRAREDRA